MECGGDRVQRDVDELDNISVHGGDFSGKEVSAM